MAVTRRSILICQIIQQFVYLLCLFIHLSNTISTNFSPRKDTVRTHCCPIGLVIRIPIVLILVLRKSVHLTRPDTRQSSRGWLGSSGNVKTARNLEM